MTTRIDAISQIPPLLHAPERDVEESPFPDEVPTPHRDPSRADAPGLSSVQIHVGFYLHRETGTVVTRVIDDRTREILRQIPPEERLKLAMRIQQMIGLFFDDTA
jgi:hypothetical protein